MKSLHDFKGEAAAACRRQRRALRRFDMREFWRLSDISVRKCWAYSDALRRRRGGRILGKTIDVWFIDDPMGAP